MPLENATSCSVTMSEASRGLRLVLTISLILGFASDATSQEALSVTPSTNWYVGGFLSLGRES